MGWNNPKLENIIARDVPEIKRMLTALAKLDPSLVSDDIPAGAKRFTLIDSTNWQIQSYYNNNWVPISTKLMHNVDRLDGYHAAITPNANTVAVRNADKKLEGDITGHAATASSAATLSETLPVNKGGTGATTSEQPRTNLGVPPTSHASSNTTYGLGSNLNYGHVRGDGVTTNVVAGEIVTKDVAIGGDSADLVSGRGIFNSASKADADYNDLRSQGAYTATGAATHGPGGARRVIVFAGQKDDPATTQLALPWMSSNKDQMRISLRSSHSTNGWAEWVDIITSRMFASESSAGIMKPGSGLSSGTDGTVAVDDTVVRTSGTQSISGTKTFTGALGVIGNAPGFWLKQADLKKGTLPTATQYENIYFTTSESVNHPADTVGLVTNTVNAAGKTSVELIAYKFEAGSTESAILGVYKELDGTGYGRAPTPADDSNTNHIATTAWVRKKLSDVEDSINTDISTSISTSSMVPDWSLWSPCTQNAAYTAIRNGYLYIRFACAPGESTIAVRYTPEGGTLFSVPVGNSYSASSSNGSVCIPVKKGDAYTVTTSGSVTTRIIFIHAKK